MTDRTCIQRENVTVGVLFSSTGWLSLLLGNPGATGQIVRVVRRTATRSQHELRRTQWSTSVRLLRTKVHGNGSADASGISAGMIYIAVDLSMQLTRGWSHDSCVEIKMYLGLRKALWISIKRTRMRCAEILLEIFSKSDRVRNTG